MKHVAESREQSWRDRTPGNGELVAQVVALLAALTRKLHLIVGRRRMVAAAAAAALLATSRSSFVRASFVAVEIEFPPGVGTRRELGQITGRGEFLR